MTDRQTDRRTGKNNMSPDPVGGRHKKSDNDFCIPGGIFAKYDIFLKYRNNYY